MKNNYHNHDFKHKYRSHCYRHSHSHNDIEKYRKHIKIMRPISIIISLLILYSIIKLFSTERGIYVIGFILVISLLKEVFSFLYFKRLTTYILEPIEKLKEAVEEVSVGNYGVTVNDSVPDNEIAQLIHSFNRMSVKLKESEELQKKYELNRKNLITIISHDLKTPITSILGYVQGIQEGVAHSSQKLNKYINIIYQNAQYTDKLINDLFLFSTLDIQKLDFNFTKTSIKAFMEDLFTELELELKEQNIDLDYSDEIGVDKQIELDGKRIRQVILNIINNAIKYTDKQQVIITCSLKSIDTGVKLGIKDNGPGVNPQKINDIFNQFYRVDESRSKDIGGLGLGLAIAKELVKAHNGEIWAESDTNNGTTIYFTICEAINKSIGCDLNE
ncbi:HAMP domain-containing histidine kinase [Clostridium sp. 'deep sea']|uniref:sensor histidine kinase n=1 Tax=Clostridium sp. 'deep sea' TaxID=2779445 RepID=UPI00189699E2|nr:HAMP domain-containing sensor histidine kinase [Clostridium sp. 'deep sea']QOR34899.1 HAMP domain-containing histidine kinase [Clostridium sp. 'deep sea']